MNLVEPRVRGGRLGGRASHPRRRFALALL
jgi:hypothetical protein